MLPDELVRATIEERKRQVEQIRAERSAAARLDVDPLTSRVLGWFHRRGAQRRQRCYRAEERLAHTGSLSEEDQRRRRLAE